MKVYGNGKEMATSFKLHNNIASEIFGVEHNNSSAEKSKMRRFISHASDYYVLISERICVKAFITYYIRY